MPPCCTRQSYANDQDQENQPFQMSSRRVLERLEAHPRSCGTGAVRFWKRFQVELKGRFSAQRVGRAREYCESISWIRVILLCLLTPLPALVVITLVDCMPLEPTERGRNGNAIYWIRMHLFIFIMVSGRIKQFHCCVPRLDLRVRQVVAVAFATATSATLFVYVLSSAVGFPVPFAVICASLMGLPTAIFSMFMVLRKMIRTDPELKSDLDSHFLVFIGETMMTYVYPTYLSAFRLLSSQVQLAFTFVLPFIKLGLQNHFSRVLQGVDDVKPVFVVFNVDLFSAFYVTSCLQSSQSWINTLLIMAIDVLQLIISLNDARNVMKEIRSMVQLDKYKGSHLDLRTMFASNPEVHKERSALLVRANS